MRSGACIATSIARFLVLGLGNQTAGYNESYESWGITDKLKQSPYLGKEPCVLATVWPLCHVIHSNITVLSSAVLDTAMWLTIRENENCVVFHVFLLHTFSIWIFLHFIFQQLFKKLDKLKPFILYPKTGLETNPVGIFLNIS